MALRDALRPGKGVSSRGRVRAPCPLPPMAQAASCAAPAVPRMGPPSSHCRSDDFGKLNPVHLCLEIGGSLCLLLLILATSLIENKKKNFFFKSGLADGGRRKGFLAWPPARGGGCPGAPLLMASFLLMNMLFVLF